MKPTVKLQWLGKKRGHRRTGSRVAGGLGEAVFFGVLFLLGTTSLTALVTSQLLDPTPELYRPGFGFWLVLLVVASLMLIGGIGVLRTVGQVGASAERRSDLVRRATKIDLIQDALPSPQEFPNVPRDERLMDSPGINLPYRLPSEGQRTVWKLATMAGLSLLLTGSASVLGVLFTNSLFGGQIEWLALAFSLPLLGVGVWSTNYLLREIWWLNRIGPTYVEISDFPLYPGREYKLMVSQAGRFSLESFHLALVCEEEATYHQGTDVRTETRQVSQQTIVEQEKVNLEPGSPHVVQFTVAIPDNAAHSFQSTHNAVRWKLVVKGEPASCPPFDRNFPVIIYPSQHGTNAAPVAPARSQTQGSTRIAKDDQSLARQVNHGTAHQPADSESTPDAPAR